MKIKDIIESLSEDEYGAVCAVLNYVNIKNDSILSLSTAVKDVNSALFERAEEFRDGNETQA